MVNGAQDVQEPHDERGDAHDRHVAGGPDRGEAAEERAQEGDDAGSDPGREPARERAEEPVGQMRTGREEAEAREDDERRRAEEEGVMPQELEPAVRLVTTGKQGLVFFEARTDTTPHRVYAAPLACTP